MASNIYLLYEYRKIQHVSLLIINPPPLLTNTNSIPNISPLPKNKVTYEYQAHPPDLSKTRRYVDSQKIKRY